MGLKKFLKDQVIGGNGGDKYFADIHAHQRYDALTTRTVVERCNPDGLTRRVTVYGSVLEGRRILYEEDQTIYS